MLRLSALPAIGIRTRAVASSTTSAGKPWASGPNNHAVGRARSMSSRLTEPSSTVANTCNPASRRPATTASVSGSAMTGMEKMLPAEARRHLPLYGSTLGPASITASAPMASATRMMVPALPGSETPTGTATNVGASASTCSRPASGIVHTATRPTGVTVSDKAFAARSVTSWVGVPASRSANRAAASSVANTSETSPRRSAASTRLGPSARKRAARRRPVWRCSLTAATTRAERSVRVRQPRPTGRSRRQAVHPWPPRPAR